MTTTATCDASQWFQIGNQVEQHAMCYLPAAHQGPHQGGILDSDDNPITTHWYTDVTDQMLQLDRVGLIHMLGSLEVSSTRSDWLQALELALQDQRRRVRDTARAVGLTGGEQ